MWYRWVSALQKILNSIRWLRSWRKDLEKSVILFILYSSFDKKILQVLYFSFNNNMLAEIGQVIQQCNNAEVGQVMHSLTNFVNVPVLLFWLCASNVCSFASCIYCIWKYYIIYIHNRACLFTPPFFGNMNTPKQITFDCQKCQIGSSLCNIYLLMW